MLALSSVPSLDSQLRDPWPILRLWSVLQSPGFSQRGRGEGALWLEKGDTMKTVRRVSSHMRAAAGAEWKPCSFQKLVTAAGMALSSLRLLWDPVMYLS